MLGIPEWPGNETRPKLCVGGVLLFNISPTT